MTNQETQDINTTRICAVVLSCDRPNMLMNTLLELNGNVDTVIVIDDCSNYDYKEHANLCQYIRTNERYGKRNHYKMWRKSFDIIRNLPKHDLYLFIPDDFSNIQIKKIITIHSELNYSAYAHNIIFDGRTMCWNNKSAFTQVINKKKYQRCFYVDCGFFCNYETLKKLQFKIDAVPIDWFTNEEISSGVGYQLTNRMNQLNINIYLPFPNYSLAFHGAHDSKMHYNLRSKNPLISR